MSRIRLILTSTSRSVTESARGNVRDGAGRGSPGPGPGAEQAAVCSSVWAPRDSLHGAPHPAPTASSHFALDIDYGRACSRTWIHWVFRTFGRRPASVAANIGAPIRTRAPGVQQRALHLPSRPTGP